ncbi:MAG: COX15/CtaA family protein [Gaiellales bacterium]
MEAGATRASRLPAVSLGVFRGLTYAALGALLLIVVSGATVRLTASGLGCENWPRCGETFLPEKDFHALVEFGNRVVGFAVGIVTLLVAGAAWRVERLPRWLVWAATALPFTVLAQGVLGGVTVVFELHPLIVMAHFLLSLVAIAVAVLVVLGALGLSDGERPAPAATALALAAVPSALVLVVTGALVTAAGPHSGGEEIARFGNVLDAVHVHIGATAVFGVTFLGLVVALAAGRLRTELALAGGVLALLMAQMAIGEVQWRNGLPWGLVLVHVGLATLVWTGVVALAGRLVLRSRRLALP